MKSKKICMFTVSLIYAVLTILNLILNYKGIFSDLTFMIFGAIVLVLFLISLSIVEIKCG